MRARYAWAFAISVALSGQASASAQELRAGRAVQGVIAAGDAVEDGLRRDVYSLNGQAGQTFEITLDGPAARATELILVVRGPNNENLAYIASTRLAYVAMQITGTYQITVTELTAGDRRLPYTLRVRPISAQSHAHTGPAQPVGVGTSMTGELARGDARRSNGALADAYLIEGQAGQRIEVRAHSSAFNPFLGILGPDGFFHANSMDDLSRERLSNARLTVTLPHSGQYRIIASTSRDEPASGSYTLQIVDGETADQDRATLIAAAPSYLSRARAALDNGQNERAVTDFEYALRLDPQNVEARNDLGVAEMRRDSPGIAAYHFGEALRIRPDYELAQSNLEAARRQMQQSRQERAQREAAFQAERRASQQRESEAWGRLATGALAVALGRAPVSPPPQPRAPIQGQQPPPASGVAPNAAPPGITDPARQRYVHNPAADARPCVTQSAHPNGRSTIFANNCGVTIELFWCSVTSGHCDRAGDGGGNTWTLGAGRTWGVSLGEYRWGACRGANSGRFDRGSQGTRYTCSMLDPP